MTAPKPGVYRDVPPEKYHSWKLASSHALSELLRSPAHMRAYQDGEYRETPALTLGRAIHAAVLEPDRFTSDYAFFSGKRNNKEGKAEYEELLQDHDAGNILTHDQWQTCLAVRDAAFACSKARGLITGRGDAELSLVWKDETGVKCKCRWDRWSPELPGGVCVDLKSTTDASPYAFSRDFYRYGYHIQGTHNMRGGAALNMAAKHYAVIAVEKEPPYGVLPYRMDDADLQYTAPLVEALLRRYAQVMKQKTFEGYPDKVHDLRMPQWMFDLMERQTEEVGA